MIVVWTGGLLLFLASIAGVLYPFISTMRRWHFAAGIVLSFLIMAVSAPKSESLIVAEQIRGSIMPCEDVYGEMAGIYRRQGEAIEREGFGPNTTSYGHVLKSLADKQLQCVEQGLGQIEQISLDKIPDAEKREMAEGATNSCRRWLQNNRLIALHAQKFPKGSAFINYLESEEMREVHRLVTSAQPMTQKCSDDLKRLF